MSWKWMALWPYWFARPRRGSRCWLHPICQCSDYWKVWPRKYHCICSLLPTGSKYGQVTFFFKLKWIRNVELKGIPFSLQEIHNYLLPETLPVTPVRCPEEGNKPPRFLGQSGLEKNSFLTRRWQWALPWAQKKGRKSWALPTHPLMVLLNSQHLHCCQVAI